MKPAKISIIFFAISSLLSHASFIPDEIFPSSTAVSKPFQLEDAERTAAVVRPEKSTEGSISAAVEPFHHSTSPSDVRSAATSTTRSTPTSCAPSATAIEATAMTAEATTTAVEATAMAHGHLGWREIPYSDDMIRFSRGFPAEIRLRPMRWPRMPKEFLGEMQQIPTRMPEFERGLWKERLVMVHGMREAEGREVTREEKVREKRKEGEDGNLVNRF